jgi:hypothetical protein
MEMVRYYDAPEPTTLQNYCDFLGFSKQEFYALVDRQRDPALWQRNAGGEWEAMDAVFKHAVTEREEKQRVAQSADRTFAAQNRHLYFNHQNPPLPSGDPALGIKSLKFRVL